ncbi:Amino Acid-Polyamine-Organocation (APC) Family [Achlya hypogyna]|uniref:Amino Acid-Polyamine-Organocation (APC) Family n=1 Tax=Achlya hypogyna TaxID=1202772 RepID=A0A1V9YA13_ACHHY|nr:Amino Acid-Polyamine-Organocation (APC) Family [Achlya hypogyna]
MGHDSTPLVSVKPRHTALDIWALGITVVIGGQYFSWNAGLVAGFYSYFGALLLMAAAYVCMALCLAEASSMLPFAGGAYGISRCSLGFYLGFIIGCCEALEYVAYVASSVLSFGEMLNVVFPSLVGYEPAVWLVVYVAAIVPHVYGDAFFWCTNRVLAVVSLVPIGIYILGVLCVADWDVNDASPLLHRFEAAQVLGNCPLIAWMFVGIEGINLACDEVSEPKSIVPKGQVACILTLVASAMMVFVLSAFAPPGLEVLTTAIAPLDAGYMRVFGVSSSMASLFSIPATYATIVGFIYAYRKLACAITESKLLPPICARVKTKHKTPVVVLGIGCGLSYLLCIAVFFAPSIEDHLFSVCILSAFCAYSAQCYGFIYLRRRFGHLDRQFTSPVGNPGALFAMGVWILNIVSILAFQTQPGVAAAVFAIVVALLSVYYHVYAKHRQTISDDERQILFITKREVRQTFETSKLLILSVHRKMMPSPTTYAPTTTDIWALGITIVIGGQYFSWNAGLVAGFYSYLGSTILMGVAYCCMVLCLAEVSSALPFAGGAYGIARCSLGFYMGFMIGCCETLEYIAYVASSVLTLGKMIVTVVPALSPVAPVIWLVVYAAALGVHLVGGQFFWRVNLVLALGSLVIVSVYVIGSLSVARSETSAIQDAQAFDASLVLEQLPTTAWFFIGIESLNLACDDVSDPRRKIPKGQLLCMATLVVSGLLVLIASFHVAPDIAALRSYTVPFNNGFTKMTGMSTEAATLLSLPATFATIFGFIYSYGKLTTAIASSQLLPPIFLHKWFASQVHGPSLLLTSAIGYVVCLITYFVPSIGDHIFSVCIFSAFCAYTAQCIGYIYLHVSFPHVERHFRSPLGIAGAVIPMAVWLLNLVSIVGFQEDNQLAFVAFATMWSVFSVYYHVYAKARQTLSDDERKILFVTHIAIFNKARSANKGRCKKAVQSTPKRHSTGTTAKSTVTPEASTLTSAASAEAIGTRAKSATAPPSSRRKSSVVTVMIVPVSGGKGETREIDGR